MKSADQLQIKNVSDHKIPKRKNFIEAFYSQISKAITPYIAKTRLTPNQVTLISALLGITGALLLILHEQKTSILAGVLIQSFIVLDFVDGDLARMKDMCSLKGAWLDTFIDKLIDLVMIMCLTVGAYSTVNASFVWMLGLILMGTQFLIQFLFIYNRSIFSNKDNINSDEDRHENKRAKSLQVEKLFIFGRFSARHLLLEANTFWLLLSLFAFTNELLLGLIFLTLMSLLTLVFVTFATLYKFTSIHHTTL